MLLDHFNPYRYGTTNLPLIFPQAHATAQVTSSGFNSTPAYVGSGDSAYIQKVIPLIRDSVNGGLGFRAYLGAYPGTQKLLAALTGSGGTPQCSVSVEPDGAIKAWTGNLGTEIGATAAAAFPLTTWTKVGLKAFINPSSGSLEIHIDGAPVLHVSGNTAFETNIRWDGIRIGLSASLKAAHGYVFDGSSPGVTDLKPDAYVLDLGPAGAGYSGHAGEWSPTGATVHQSIDEADHNSDTDVITASATLARYSVQVDTLTVPGVPSIYGLKQTAIVKNYAGLAGPNASPSHSLLVNVAGADYIDAWQSCTNSAWRAIQKCLDRDPSTAASWDVAGVNAARYGGQVRG